ncbi:MAG: flippase-like domain-containing protein [Pseudoflavonifractor sp.]|nr:flippase-like domain-containing protein [Pseudoflavonifractor sp.]
MNHAPTAKEQDDHWKDWRKMLGTGLRYVLPLIVSVGLIVWLFNKVDIRHVMDIVRHGCDYGWIILMMAITTLSHIIRGIRWGIQLRAVGIPRMSVTAYSVSIFGAYALNLVFPRLGEVWRCVYITRKENASLSSVVGTDLGDRASDAVVVAALLGLTLIVAHPAIEGFLTKYAIGKDIAAFADNPWLWCLIAIFVGVAWTVLHFCRNYRYIRDIDGVIDRLWNGFKVLFTMKGIGQYILLTFSIWICYYLETYVCFFAFPFTRELITSPGMAAGLIPGLVVFVFGSFSMAVPSNGGLGPWNLAVMFALSLYGISNTEGAAFSIVMWSFQAGMLVILGIFSAIYVSMTRRSHTGGTAATGNHSSGINTTTR